jgi:hypothetical protein
LRGNNLKDFAQYATQQTADKNEEQQVAATFF